ncbi:hypothetical protein KQH82_07670 [bacterium]|nr:hypothetical protein [bacterium]
MSRAPIPSLVLTLFALLLFATAAPAANQPSIEILRSSDNTVSRSVLSGSSYEGSLDLTGFHLRLSPTEGPVIVRTSGYDSYSLAPDAAVVQAAALYQGVLIVAGRFSPVASTRSSNIVGWDGERWVSIGRFGTNGPVFALTVFEHNLIVAGDFATAGNDLVNHIAAWDGQYFSPLSQGLQGPVFSLAVHRHRLIAAGLNGLGRAYGTGQSGVIAWNGSKWLFDGMEIQGIVREVATSGDQLSVTGQFFGFPIGRPDTTLYFDGAAWSTSTGTHAVMPR